MRTKNRASTHDDTDAKERGQNACVRTQIFTMSVSLCVVMRGLNGTCYPLAEKGINEEEKPER